MQSFIEFTQKTVGEKLNTNSVIDQLVFNAQGLIPAIAQQHDTGEVLMMAWMNKAALEETLSTGRVCYWSRSRQQFWRKGESSGNEQQVVKVIADCDGDTLLLMVNQSGPACHTNRTSCFFLDMALESTTVLSNPA